MSRLEKWNDRHQSSESRPQPCYLLRQFIHQLPKNAPALDVACGRGGNALALAAQGFQTSAWDYSPVALERLRNVAKEEGLEVNGELIDLEAISSAPKSGFGAIVVSHYLHRPLCSILSSMLVPGGRLVYQGFLRCENPSFGPRGDSSFRLFPGEIAELFGSLRTILHEEVGAQAHPSELTNMVFFAAERPA